jgi:chromosomal replication initiation ATPase DnaA
MSGYLHALVEDAAREAECTVADMLSTSRRNHVVRARHTALILAFDAGFSREQIGRVVKRSKRTVVRTGRKAKIAALQRQCAEMLARIEQMRGSVPDILVIHRQIAD